MQNVIIYEINMLKIVIAKLYHLESVILCDNMEE